MQRILLKIALKKINFIFLSNGMSYVCHSYVIRMSLVCTPMSFVCTCMLSVCHSYVLLCHSYVLVCHPYVTSMYSHVICMSLVCHSLAAVTEPTERAFGEQADFLEVFYQSKSDFHCFSHYMHFYNSKYLSEILIPSCISNSVSPIQTFL